MSGIEAGFRGYVLKANAGEELIPAIQEAAEGRVFVSPVLARPSGRS